MLKNYFTIALRNLWNRKIYSGINLLGLSVTAAFCLLVFMYMQQEGSFDKFHRNAGRLYRLEATSLFQPGENERSGKGFFSFLKDKDDDTRNMLTQSYVMADDIRSNFPEVEDVARFQSAGDLTLWYNNEPYKIGTDQTTYAEKNFFRLFDFPLEEGTATGVLEDKSSVVISQKLARLVFGKTDPVGRTIAFSKNDSVLHTITGVMKDFPVNSSFQFDLVMPLEAHPSHQEDKADHSNNHFSYITLLLLKQKTDAQAFNKKLRAFSRTYFADAIKEWQQGEEDKRLADFHLSIRPFTRAHYNSSYPWGHYTNQENMYELGLLALVILLIACVNYVLLSLTNTVSRSQEVGIRKTMGAGRRNIVLQFLLETQLLVLFSVLAGIVICVSTLPFFNSITDAGIRLRDFPLTAFLGGAAALFLLLGLAAGLYPALVMSGMRPLNMLRKFSSVRINPVLSKGLVVMQYAACVMLIISSLVITRQMRYMNRMDLGFDKEQVLLVENPYDWDSPDRTALDGRLAQYAASEPAISGYAAAASKFGYGFNLNGHLVNGKREMIFHVPVDFNYFGLMKIRLLKGRYFSKEMLTDTARIDIPADKKVEGSSAVRRAVVVNKSLYNLLGQPPLDEINPSLGAIIIGVCDDYQFFNTTQKVGPAYHTAGSRTGFNFFYFKIKPGQDLPAVLARIRSGWNSITAKQPFVFSFLDEEVKKGYLSYTRWLKTINAAMVLAVLIACLGLFGLSALYAVNRTKEVGIRKVMGASVTGLFFMLNKGVLRLAIISFMMAIPLAVYFMKKWLQNFASRIELSWVYFAAAGIIAILLAILSVNYHAVKAASANPVDSLRSE
ncbi:MAG: ABC transporter permease [Chitinophagaceae bacterium]